MFRTLTIFSHLDSQTRSQIKKVKMCFCKNQKYIYIYKKRWQWSVSFSVAMVACIFMKFTCIFNYLYTNMHLCMYVCERECMRVTTWKEICTVSLTYTSFIISTYKWSKNPNLSTVNNNVTWNNLFFYIFKLGSNFVKVLRLYKK